MKNHWPSLIDAAWENHALLKESKTITTIQDILAALDQGFIRVASYEKEQWIIHEWIKKAVTLYFAICKMQVYHADPCVYYDKIPLKKDYAQKGVRVIPSAVARYGAYVAPGAVLLDAFVNIGAYIGENTLIDIKAGIGSCAQIGKNIHISAGVIIGGVLEPIQAKPVIIEDGAFIGANSVIVEGVHIGKKAVIAAGVTLTATTKIIDVNQKAEEQNLERGYIPDNAVVVPGTVKKKFVAGEYYMPCAMIIGERKKSTDEKTALNNTLRAFDLSV